MYLYIYTGDTLQTVFDVITRVLFVVCKSKNNPKKQKLDVFTSLNECSFGTKCLLIIEKLY